MVAGRYSYTISVRDKHILLAEDMDHLIKETFYDQVGNALYYRNSLKNWNQIE